MTSIQLTAPLIDTLLTAQERPSNSLITSHVILADDTRITRAGNRRVTRAGNVRVAHNSYYANPIAVTGALIDYELTAQERP